MVINKNLSKEREVLETTKTKILDVAKALFREKGYSSVSTNTIIEAVGIKKPTLYYYFKNKEALFCNVLIYMLESGNHYIVNNIKASHSLDKKLCLLAEGYFEFSPTSLATMMRDGKQNLSTSNLKKVLEANQFYIIRPFEQIFEDAIEKKELRSLKSKDLATVFISLLDVFTVNTSVKNGRVFSYKEKAKLVVDLFLNGATAR